MSDDSDDDRLWMMRQAMDEDGASPMFFPDRTATQNDSVTSFPQ